MSAASFLLGVNTLASLVVSGFFLRYYRETRERLFGYFSLAFAVFAANWLLVAFLRSRAESTPYVYGVRLVAFGLIAVAILDKNRAHH